MRSLARRNNRGVSHEVNNDLLGTETSPKQKTSIKMGKRSGLWKKRLVPSNALVMVLVSAFIFTTMVLIDTSPYQEFQSTVGSFSSADTRVAYEINIAKDTNFSDDCNVHMHTFEFKSGKVKWINGGFAYLSRGMSLHCMLARAAERLGPNFTTSMRITTADKDLNSSLCFGPAATEEQMKTSNITPLLFPDNTFESWPEVFDFSLPESVARVRTAAEKNGLPGSQQWMNRKPQLLWRGYDYGRERNEMINKSLTSPLLDIKPTKLNFNFSKNATEPVRLAPGNRVTREEHCQYRFLLHMNGEFNDRYSSALKWKLLCGSLVFVPVKPLFVEWWNYQTWKPYIHYVPYKSSEDLLRKVLYYSDHLDDASKIAQKGMELAQNAFNEVPNFIDSTLRRYHQLTGHLPRKPCAAKKTGGGDYEFQSLDDLKKEYGPKVCA